MGSEFVQAIPVSEIAAGGMKAVTVNGREIVVCDRGGSFVAISRRCGHMNAPLEMGTLDGDVVTCPMHCAQFDVSTGEPLCGPVPGDLGGEVLPPRLAASLRNVGMLVRNTRTEGIATFPVRVEADWIWVAV